jgi:hypothetical protein
MVYKKKNLNSFFLLAFSCVAKGTGRVVFLQQNNTMSWG